MRRCLATLLLVLATGPAAAQIAEVGYDLLAETLDGRIGFETLPRRAEPGFDLSAPVREPGVRIGEHFAGQAVAGDRFDRVGGAPTPPLSVRAGASGQNLSVAFHRGFGSNALFALGPRGFPDLAARGEGAVAVLFDRDQSAFGLRVHSDYAVALGGVPNPGTVELRLYSRDGRLIAAHRHPLVPGITGIGLSRVGGVPDIAGFTLTTDDPGGIAIDDILFQLVGLTG